MKIKSVLVQKWTAAMTAGMMAVGGLSVSSVAMGFSGGSSRAPETESPTRETRMGKVWVSRSDGARSCGAKEGQSVEDVSRELIQAGIKVYEARKGSDGKLHAQVCGASKGTVNAFLISDADFQKARALGFEVAPASFN